MAEKWTEWERVVSAGLAPPAVPMTALTLGIDEDTGAEWDDRAPVLGVLTTVVESYVRPVRPVGYDFGSPRLPPSPRSLAEEGYRFQHRVVRMRYVTHSAEVEAPDDDPESSNTRVLYYPAAEEGPPGWAVDEARESLRRWLERTRGERTQPAKDAPPGA